MLKEWIEPILKVALLAWNIVLIIGGLILLKYSWDIGYLPDIRIEDITATLFSLTLVGTFYTVALVATFLAPVVYWRSLEISLKTETEIKQKLINMFIPFFYFFFVHLLTWGVMLCEIQKNKDRQESTSFWSNIVIAAWPFILASIFAFFLRKRLQPTEGKISRWQQVISFIASNGLAGEFSFFFPFLILLPLYEEWGTLFAAISFYILLIGLLAGLFVFLREDFKRTAVILFAVLALILWLLGDRVVAGSMRSLGLGNKEDVWFLLNQQGKELAEAAGYACANKENSVPPGCQLTPFLVTRIGTDYVLKEKEACDPCEFLVLPKSYVLGMKMPQKARGEIQNKKQPNIPDELKKDKKMNE